MFHLQLSNITGSLDFSVVSVELEHREGKHDRHGKTSLISFNMRDIFRS